MYEGGGAFLVQILLTSENMGEFLNKAEYVATISKYDRSMLEELQQVRANVEKKQKDLEEQQSKLSGLQETLTSKRDELNSKIFIHFRRTGKLSGTVGSCQSSEEALKLAQNDKISGSVKSEASNQVTQPILRITRIKQIQQQTVRLIKIKITPLIIPATILPTQATTPMYLQRMSHY